MDVLPPGWEDLTAKALLGIAFFMVFLGWLIPKRTHEREMRDKDATIAVQRETIERLTTATQNLAVSANTSAAALRSIAKEAQNTGSDGS